MKYERVFAVFTTAILIIILFRSVGAPPVLDDIPGFSYKWTFYTGAYSHLGTLAVDVDGDDIYEVFASGRDRVVCVDGETGQLIWDYTDAGCDTHAPMEIGDLNNDGTFEIVICGFRKVTALHAENGSFYWSYSNPRNARLDKHPVILDVDQNGYPYVFVVSGCLGSPTARGLQKLNGTDGTCVAYASYNYWTCWGGVSCADLERDGDFEIILNDRNFYSSGKGIQCYDADTLDLLWYHDDVSCSSSTSAIIDVNNDGILDVVTVDQSGGGYHGGICVTDGSNGQKMSGKWDRDLGLPCHSPFSIYDIDEDNHLELVTASYISENNPTPLPAKVWDMETWSLDATLDAFSEPPKMANVVGDEKLEIIGAWGSRIKVYDGNYTEIYSLNGTQSNAGILVQDIDRDGLNEIVFVGNKDITAYDTEAQASTPNVRTNSLYFSERNCGTGIYVPPPGENTPPNTPSDPNPDDGATNVGVNVDLSWTGGDPDPGDTVTYDVYFGTTSPPPLVVNNQSDTTYDPGTLALNTTYYWKVVAWDNLSASTAGPIWSFTTRVNNPPYEPSNPSPENGATDVDINIDLSWTGGDPDPGDTVTYDVYFGTSSPPLQVEWNQSGTVYDPGILEFEKTYYWKIHAWDEYGASSEGPIWSFTTEENVAPYIPSDPDPEDGETDVNIEADLSWTGGDPNSGDTVTYDVYFGTTSPPPLVVNNQSDASYDPGKMDLNTTYYWQIVSWDSQEESTSGPIWHFTTAIAPNAPPNKPSIAGSQSGKAGVEYEYTISAVDPNEDNVKYFIDWDDGNTEWTDYHGSGEEVTIGHTWDNTGTYTIRVKAKDTHGEESEWETLDVQMPMNNQLFYSQFIQPLKRIIQLFPLLKQIFSLLPIFTRMLFDLLVNLIPCRIACILCLLEY